MGYLAAVATLFSCFWCAPPLARAAAVAQSAAPQAPRSSARTPATAAGKTAGSDPGLTEAKALVQKGLLGQGERATRLFLSQHADSAEGHYLLGYILFDELHEKYLNEEEKQGRSLRYNDSVDAPLSKLRDEKARESLAEFSAGARYATPSAFDLKIVALDYLLLKDEPSAEKWLSVSVKMNPKDAQAWFYLGRTQYSETKYLDAIETFQQCLKLEPKNVVAEYNVGLSLEGLGQKDQAIQAYQNAIAWEAQSETKSPEPFVDLARLYLDQNQADKAVPYLLQAVAAFPQVSLAHEELGKAYSILKRLPEAQEQLEKAAQLSPEKASLRCLLGQVYQREKMPAKAQVEFDRCAALQNAKTATPAPKK